MDKIIWRSMGNPEYVLVVRVDQYSSCRRGGYQYLLAHNSTIWCKEGRQKYGN